MIEENEILTKFANGNNLYPEDLITILTSLGTPMSNTLIEWINNSLYVAYINIKMDDSTCPVYIMNKGSIPNDEFYTCLLHLYDIVKIELTDPATIQKLRRQAYSRNELRKIHNIGGQYDF
jgi:hypothetical protein